MRILTLLVSILNLISVLSKTVKYTPIVLWHGIADSSLSPVSMGDFKDLLTELLPGVEVLSLKIGENVDKEVKNSYRLHPDKQIKIACDIIISHKSSLSYGFNAIGFSQGGLFMRGLVQRCSEGKVNNLITLGSPHQGIYGLPQCGMNLRTSCNFMRKILKNFAYARCVQNNLVPATYWHDPIHENTYKKYSTFLSDINNEININSSYVSNLQALKNFVMVKYSRDTMVEPIATEWFGFYTPGQSVQTQKLQESEFFLKNRLGLQEMAKQSKLHFLKARGEHLNINPHWFKDNVVDPFLK